MKKLLKIFSIILVVVMSATMLIGCDLFVLNDERYRQQGAVTVGNEKSSLGEVIDYFETNGNSYLQQGYAAQEVWNFLFKQYKSLLIINDQYKSDDANKISGGKYADYYKSNLMGDKSDSAYLTDAEIEYNFFNIITALFGTLDSETVKVFTEKGYTFDEATKEEARVKETQITTISGGYFSNTSDKTTQDNFFKKYNATVVAGKDIKADDFVYSADSQAKLDKEVEELNKRIGAKSEQKDNITAKQYKEAQLSAFNTVTRTLGSNYGKTMTLSEYAKRQMTLALKQQVATKWTYNFYLANIENADGINKSVEEYYNTLKAKQDEKYKLNPTQFLTDVNGATLANTSFVLSVPSRYKGAVGSVANVLIPFTKEQTEELAKLKALGASEIEITTVLQKYAKELELKNYTTDDKGVVEKVGDTAVKVLEADGSLSANCVTKFNDKTINQLIYAYNTDPGMFNKAYGYVIPKNEVDDTDNALNVFVPEFIKKGRLAVNGVSADNRLTGKTYQIAITEFGIHIIFALGDVGLDFDGYNWSAATHDLGSGAGSAYYRLKKAYMDTTAEAIYGRVVEKMFIDAKISVVNKTLNMYMDKLGLEKVDAKKDTTK